MGKKFVTINKNNRLYRLYLDDIRAAVKRPLRNTPKIPLFSVTHQHPTLDVEEPQSESLQTIKLT